MERYTFLLICGLMLAGCQTTYKIEQEKSDHLTKYSCVNSNGVTEPFLIKVNDKTGEVGWENEPPTLSQMASYSDEIFEQVILPKWDKGLALDEAEMAVLACCLNVRISMVNVMNGTILRSMQLSPEKSLTYGMVAHPKVDQVADLGTAEERKVAEDKRRSSEKAFIRMLEDLVKKDIQSDSTFNASVKDWGKTFSGDGSFNLNKSEREKILRQILANAEFDDDYLSKGFWRTVMSFFFWDASTHERPLPGYANQYALRKAHIAWREHYGEDRDVIMNMYDSLCRATEEASNESKDIQKDRLSNLKDAFSERVKAIERADLLVFDYPFALTLLECMRMMDYYDRNEWCNVTLDEVKENKYKPLARSLVECTSTLRMNQIRSVGLSRIYEKVYVPFLGKSFGMTSKELYCAGLIPFSVDVEFDLKPLKSGDKVDPSQSTIELLLKE